MGEVHRTSLYTVKKQRSLNNAYFLISVQAEPKALGLSICQKLQEVSRSVLPKLCITDSSNCCAPQLLAQLTGMVITDKQRFSHHCLITRQCLIMPASLLFLQFGNHAQHKSVMLQGLALPTAIPAPDEGHRCRDADLHSLASPQSEVSRLRLTPGEPLGPA